MSVVYAAVNLTPFSVEPWPADPGDTEPRHQSRYSFKTRLTVHNPISSEFGWRVANSVGVLLPAIGKVRLYYPAAASTDAEAEALMLASQKCISLMGLGTITVTHNTEPDSAPPFTVVVDTKADEANLGALTDALVYYDRLRLQLLPNDPSVAGAYSAAETLRHSYNVPLPLISIVQYLDEAGASFAESLGPQCFLAA